MNLINVKFNGEIVEVIENGRRWVGVSRICDNLGIASYRQIEKLKSDPTFEARLLKVPTPGGIQEVFCIPLEKLNGWLFTINPNKVRPEVKEKLIAYKNECFKVLYDHFVKKSHAAAVEYKKSLRHVELGYKSHIARLKRESKRVERELRKELKEQEKRIKALRRKLAYYETTEQPFTAEKVMELIEKGLKYDELMERYIEVDKVVQMFRVNEEYVKHFVNLLKTTYKLIHSTEEEQKDPKEPLEPMERCGVLPGMV